MTNIRMTNSWLCYMRHRAEWMKPVDDEIMEYIEKEGAASPSTLADALNKNNDYLSTRCRALELYGLLRRPSRGIYFITEEGERYLRGDLDASELESDETR